LHYPTLYSVLTSCLELTRTLNTLAIQYEEKVSSHSTASHASHIVELDTEKFRIAKAASELEIEGEKLEAELDRLKNRLQELEAQGVEGDEMERMRRQSDDPIV
jgi:kinetochore protein Spc24